MKHVALHLTCLIAAGILLDKVAPYVLNRDPQYQPWTGRRVPFYFQSGDYTSQEQQLIWQAMQKMSSDLGECVTFQPITVMPVPAGMNHVIISKAGGPGVPSPTCYSYPGMVAAQNGAGQQMSIQGGRSGCMTDGRSIMRLLASLLGLRSEHNKPGRGQFIQVAPFNVELAVQPYVPVAELDSTKVLSNYNDFDVNSITLIDPVEFSGNGGPVISSMGRPFLNTGSLSMKDCQALIFYYNCPNVQCRDPYGAGGLPNAQFPAQNGQPSNNPNFPNNGQFQPVSPNLPINGQQQQPVFPNFPNNGQQQPTFPNLPNNGQQQQPVFPNLPNNGQQQQPVFPNFPSNGQQQQPVFPNLPNNGQQQQPVFPNLPNNGQQQQPVFPNLPNNGQQQQPVFPNLPNNGQQQQPVFPNFPNNGQQQQPVFPNLPNNGQQQQPVFPIGPNGQQQQPNNINNPNSVQPSGPVGLGDF